MKLSPVVSVVIPCFNDGCRIGPVIAEIKKSALVLEIIVVDDGSNAESKNILQKTAGIKLITHPKNLGKSAAMKTGVLAATGEIIAFIDADLKNFTYQHLDSLLSPAIKQQSDMVLGDRTEETWYVRLIGFTLAFTGERAFHRQKLLDNLDVFDAPGYLIEASFNQRFFHNFKVSKVLLNKVGQCGKIIKVGFVEGLTRDMRMFKRIFSFLGIKEFFYQLYFATCL